VLKPGGRIAYYTIHLADGLTPAQRRRAAAAGPNCVAARATQDALLRAAGFRDAVARDVTDEYLRLARAWRAARDRREPALRAVQGDAKFDEQRADNLAQIAAIEAGLLRRSLLTATR